jgi:hypothetical protein
MKQSNLVAGLPEGQYKKLLREA